MAYYNEVKNLPSLFEQFYKKYLKRNNKISQYGESIAHKLYLGIVLKDYAVVLNEISQIQYFLETALDDNNYKVIFQLDEDKNWRYYSEF